MQQVKRAVYVFCMLLLFLGLIIDSPSCIEGAKDGISICLRIIIPSLFVFVLCTLLLVRFCGGFIASLFAPIICPLFNISTRAVLAFILGLFGGYPIGAKVTSELYLSHDIEKDEAERLLSFCNNAGPMFVIGAVGNGFLGSAKTGAVLYFIHILSSVTVGIIFGMLRMARTKRNYLHEIKKEWDSITIPHFTKLFSECSNEAIRVISTICANIVFFSVIIRLLNNVPAFLMLPSVISNGILELSCGVSMATGRELMSLSFILAFGGLCVHSQTEGVLSKSGLSTNKYYIGKSVSAILSVLYTKLLLSFGAIPVFSPSQYFAQVSTNGLYAVLCIFIVIILLSVYCGKRLAGYSAE